MNQEMQQKILFLNIMIIFYKDDLGEYDTLMSLDEKILFLEIMKILYQLQY